MRYILGLIIVILTFFSVRYYITYRQTVQEVAQIKKAQPHYLCDKKIADCNANPAGSPKGVCAPGGKCT